jgi:hypothetical protein
MPEDLVLEILKSIQADVATIKSELGLHGRLIDVLVRDGRMIRAALNDLGKTRVSAGEAEAMHTDINDLIVRVTKIEERLGSS